MTFKYLRSTPERRAAIFKIKLMFDEAHRLREEGNLAALAEQIADIQIHMAEINRGREKALFTHDEECESAAFVRANGAKAGFQFLDIHLESSAESLRLLEEMLRISFEVEMADSSGVESGEIEFY